MFDTSMNNEISFHYTESKNGFVSDLEVDYQIFILWKIQDHMSKRF